MVASSNTASVAVDTHQITEDQWAALLCAPVAGPPYMGSDRRNCERHRRIDLMRFEMGLRWIGRARERYIVRTRDVSREGIGFLHSGPITPGTRCRMTILSLKGKLLEMDGCVAFCNPRADGVYAVGVCLDGPIPLVDLVTHRDANVA